MKRPDSKLMLAYLGGIAIVGYEVSPLAAIGLALVSYALIDYGIYNIHVLMGERLHQEKLKAEEEEERRQQREEAEA